MSGPEKTPRIQAEVPPPIVGTSSVLPPGRGPSLSGNAASGSSSSSGSSGTPSERASSSQSMPHLTIESLLATVKEAVEAQVATAVASLSSSLSIPPTPAPSVPSLGEFSFRYVI